MKLMVIRVIIIIIFFFCQSLHIQSVTENFFWWTENCRSQEDEMLSEAYFLILVLQG